MANETQPEGSNSFSEKWTEAVNQIPQPSGEISPSSPYFTDEELDKIRAEAGVRAWYEQNLFPRDPKEMLKILSSKSESFENFSASKLQETIVETLEESEKNNKAKAEEIAKAKEFAKNSAAGMNNEFVRALLEAMLKMVSDTNKENPVKPDSLGQYRERQTNQTDPTSKDSPNQS